jgi:hypothetical protein
VRQEVRTALELGKPIYPVLVGKDTTMPVREGLPTDIASLTGYQSRRLRIEDIDSIANYFVSFGVTPVATAGLPSMDKDKAEYLVWYGTNRRPNAGGKSYSSARDTVVHYGSCRVFVPESHKIGSIGSPWWKRWATMKDDRLQLLSSNELGESVYWREVAAHLSSVDADERNALVFVHGYNVLFEEAALRAAQIGFDLSIQGAMAFFRRLWGHEREFCSRCWLE